MKGYSSREVARLLGLSVARVRSLVRAGFITRFQAAQLLAGRHKGFRIGQYVIQDLLGRGGMGAVYLGEHLDLHRKVAIKILAPGRGEDQKLALERFLREARAAAALNHPNIVTLFDAAQEGDTLYITMELLRGTDFVAISPSRHNQDRETRTREYRRTTGRQPSVAQHGHGSTTTHGGRHRAAPVTRWLARFACWRLPTNGSGLSVAYHCRENMAAISTWIGPSGRVRRPMPRSTGIAPVTRPR